MRQFPGVGLIIFLGRGHVDGMVKPAVPARRGLRGFGYPVIDNPTPLKSEPRTNPGLAIIGVALFVMADQLAVAVGVEAGVEVRAVPPREIVEQSLLEPFHSPSA